MGRSLQPVQTPQDGIPSLLRVHCTSQLGVGCRLAGSDSIPLPTLLTKMLSTGPHSAPGPPRNTLLITALLLDLLLLVAYPLSGPSIKPMSLHFRDKAVVQDCVKLCTSPGRLCQSLSFIHLCSPIRESHQIYQARFTLSEAMLAVSSRILIFHVPQHIFQVDLLHDFAEQ